MRSEQEKGSVVLCVQYPSVECKGDSPALLVSDPPRTPPDRRVPPPEPNSRPSKMEIRTRTRSSVQAIPYIVGRSDEAWEKNRTLLLPAAGGERGKHHAAACCRGRGEEHKWDTGQNRRSEALGGISCQGDPRYVAVYYPRLMMRLGDEKSSGNHL